MRKVLLVEDNADLAFGLRTSLEVEGYDVVVAPTGPDGLESVRRDTPDLVVLDLMLPGMSGYDVLRTIRREGFDMPVLVVSAKSEEVDKVQGFRLGADDYVVKPVGVLEFLARVEALLRRATHHPTTGVVYQLSDLCIDAGRRSVTIANRPIELSPMEFDLLVALARREGGVVTRAELHKEVWGYRPSIESRTVDTHIAKLRSKIYGASPQIVTVWKRGYRMESR